MFDSKLVENFNHSTDRLENVCGKSLKKYATIIWQVFKKPWYKNIYNT